MKKTDRVDWKDVQGLVLSGYKELAFAAYIPWRFAPDNARPVRETSKVWLRNLIARLTRVAEERPVRGSYEWPRHKRHLKDSKPSDIWAVNVALTWRGLAKLEADPKQLSLFSTEFREDMAPRRSAPEAPFPRRCNILGDVGKNSPEHWEWGGWSTENGKIDGILLLYAANETSLNELIKYEMDQMGGIEFLRPVSANDDTAALILRGRLFDDFREHFGFVDGVSQPIIASTPAASRKSPTEARISVVQPGEFVLGYLNERGPSKVPSRGAAATKKNLTHNGTYLVFRQLEQNVPAFRAEMRRTARRMGKSEKWVAARMVGRTQEGDPLIPASLYQKQGKQTYFRGRIGKWIAGLVGRPQSIGDPEQRRNDFLYYFEDRFGLRCPLGAHIRRANPRDTVIGPEPDISLRLSKMHRIIRRGRPYGSRLPEKTVAQIQDERRGVLFICLNADITGQFELIQHSWINNGRFGGLYSETDPIMNYPGEAGILTIQRRPTSETVLRGDGPKRRRIDRTQDENNFEQFVTVRGGAYFFLPGIEALRSLAD